MQTGGLWLRGEVKFFKCQWRLAAIQTLANKGLERMNPGEQRAPSELQVSAGLDHHRFPDAFVLVPFSFFPLCHILRWVVCWSAVLSLFGSHVCFGSDHLIAILAALWEVSGGKYHSSWLRVAHRSKSISRSQQLVNFTPREEPNQEVGAAHHTLSNIPLCCSSFASKTCLL